MMKKPERIIFLVDMNKFYASCECFVRPEIREQPVIVGGDKELRVGIVLARNEIAAGFGIKTAMTVGEAARLCPSLVSIKPDFDLYFKFSKLARSIFERYSDKVESMGMDECYMDLTGIAKDFADAERIADNIRETVFFELGITVSVGVSFNKNLAKLASDMKKPDATTVISPENFRDVVWRLPVIEMLGVGAATAEKLNKRHIYTVGELAHANVESLTRMFGKYGAILHRFANGRDDAPVSVNGHESCIKSVSNSKTLPRDVLGGSDMKSVLYMLSESVASRLREYGLVANTVQVFTRDNEFEHTIRQGKLPFPTAISGELAERAMEIYCEKYQVKNPARMVGVRACDLMAESAPVQLDIFSDHQRRGRLFSLEHSKDGLRKRFGEGVVKRGNLLEDKPLAGIDIIDQSSTYGSFFNGVINM
jgi:DNA polymerase-4